MSSEISSKLSQVVTEARKFIFGQDKLLDSILAALVCEGHLLVEGMPGLGKTMSINTVSNLCDLNFNRIQFTPDLLPSDLIGTMVYSPESGEFSTKFGPVFTQLLLADEINRSPAKVQSALLEAMAERQVTIGDETHKLSSPFVVLGTQNPIDQEGTYRLPEAQLDRFMMKVEVDYPDDVAEFKIMKGDIKGIDTLEPVVSTDDFIEAREEIEKVYMDDKMYELIVRVTHATRPGNKHFIKEFEGQIMAGVSPRASIWLSKLCKYKAFMKGKEFVTPEELMSVIPDVMGHRILLTYEAIVDGVKGRDIALSIAKKMV